MPTKRVCACVRIINISKSFEKKTYLVGIRQQDKHPTWCVIIFGCDHFPCCQFFYAIFHTPIFVGCCCNPKRCKTYRRNSNICSICFLFLLLKNTTITFNINDAKMHTIPIVITYNYIEKDLLFHFQALTKKK